MTYDEISLNIVMSYPVKWSRYNVFRDYIQNFYDSVGCDEWLKKFCYSYNDGKLCMWVQGVTFSYEWLIHIGASTKTNDIEKTNAGFFGEGFKIASLCGYRDFNWKIVMSSNNWKLSVGSKKDCIENTSVDMLTYKLEKKEFEDISKLELSSVTTWEYEIFKNALTSFYYKQNPLFGEKIWEGEEGAVYLCNKEQYNSYLPYTSRFGKAGAVFCAYQLLGSNPFNLCICLHNYVQKDRERKELYQYEVVQIMGEVCTYITPDGAIKVLEKMRRYWNSTPKTIDVCSWAPVIRTLLWKISKSKKCTKLFKQKYPNLLCLPPLMDTEDRNRRKAARTWAKTNLENYLLVQISFELLGYPTLEEVCERNGGFIFDEKPNKLENKCMDLLEELMSKIFANFFIQDCLPERRVIKNENASYHGMALVTKLSKTRINNKGIKIKYKVQTIYFKKSIFKKSGYFDAISTCVHELCHAFGGDSSQSFSNALTIAMELLISNYLIVQEYEQKWNELFVIRKFKFAPRFMK